MKKWKYIISSFMAVAMIVGLNVQNVSADEINQNQIFPDTQARIDSTLAEYPQFEKYINGVLDTVEISDFSDDANEINSFIMQALDTVGEIGAMGQSRYQTAVQEYENRIEPRVGIAYNTALAAYNQGIRIVENRGCPNTARYMRHAICPEDSTGYPASVDDTNTSWAYSLVYDCYGFYDAVCEKFESIILPNNPSGGTVGGTFEYTSKNSSLDAFAALHRVEYSVTFTRMPNGGYKATYYIHDVYDFAWDNNGYDNFEVGFANNYCAAMQTMGWIRPFDIFITVIE